MTISRMQPLLLKPTGVSESHPITRQQQCRHGRGRSMADLLGGGIVICASRQHLTGIEIDAMHKTGPTGKARKCRDSRSSPNHGQRRSFRGRLLTMVLKSRENNQSSANRPRVVNRILPQHSLLTVALHRFTEAHEEPQSEATQRVQIL